MATRTSLAQNPTPAQAPTNPMTADEALTALDSALHDMLRQLNHAEQVNFYEADATYSAGFRAACVIVKSALVPVGHRLNAKYQPGEEATR